MSCHCGVDAIATCSRCGERRCSSHYFVAASTNGYDITAQTAGSSFVLPISHPRSWTDDDRRAWAGGGPGCDRCRMAAIGRTRNDKRSAQQSGIALIAEFRERPSSQLAREIAALPSEVLEQASPFTSIFAEVFASAEVYPYERVTARSIYKKHAIRPSIFRIEIQSREPLARVTSIEVCDQSGRVFPVDEGPCSFSETLYNNPSTTICVILVADADPAMHYIPGTPTSWAEDGTWPKHACTNALANGTSNITRAAYLSGLLEPAASLMRGIRGI